MVYCLPRILEARRNQSESALEDTRCWQSQGQCPIGVIPDVCKHPQQVSRPEYHCEKTITDPITGEKHDYYPKHKQVLRQLLSIPFAMAALLVLGTLTTGVFGIELFLSHVYAGLYKSYLEYLPTVLLALCLPYIRDWMEVFAVKLTEYENWRTQDRYEMSLTLKVFVLNFITSYLPILLSAFVYIPFGDNILSGIRTWLQSTTGWKDALAADIHVDTSRLRSEVIALTVTDQISGFGEELILPALKLRAAQWYGNWKGKNKGYNYSSASGSYVAEKEVKFLNQIRDEAEREPYNVHEDIQQMVTQSVLTLKHEAWSP
jgi:anoctamin-10